MKSETLNLITKAKMGSPISPTFPGSPTFGGVLPSRVRKVLPGIIATILLVLFISSSTGTFGALPSFRSNCSNGRFPKKIWQTWKVDPLSFDERDLWSAKTWIVRNPGHRYEVLTDDNGLDYVETNFGPEGLNRPDIVYTYRTLTAKIIKADILRYLVMYLEGGIYADIDVESLKPVSTFIPDRYDERDIDMVIGVEIDQPHFSEHSILGPKSMSFCQWTLMSKPRVPIWIHLVDNILRWLNEVSEAQNRPISDIELSFDEVISGTGPSAFTKVVLAEMSKREGVDVTWNSFHNMRESKAVGRVLVLPVDAFAAGQGHSDSGNHDSRSALVKHHYHASLWPTQHPRYSHPIVGSVETCNWNVDCVRRWDEEKAAFDALSSEEQTRQITLKQAKEEEERQAAVAALAASDQPAQFPPALP
jgi:mannosyltransferase OCH1-like enzyme